MSICVGTSPFLNSRVLSSFIKFSLIFMNMQKDNFHIGSLDERICQIVSLIKTKRKNCGLMMVWG